MKKFTYLVTVEAETEAQATEIMTNRIDVDEWYGFDYHIEWMPEPNVVLKVE